MIVAEKNTKRFKVILPFIIGLLLPPLFSMIYILFLFYNHRSEKIGMVFTFFFVLFLTYNFFSIDNIGRLNTAFGRIYNDEWLLIDPLTILIHWGINSTSLEGCHFLFFYIFLTYIFLLKTITKNTNRRFDIALLVIFITTISIRNSMDLLYYCLATTFTLWFISNRNCNVLNVVILITFVYFIHPGLLLLLLPSVALYYSMKLSIKGVKHIYTIMLILVFSFAFILSQTTSMLLSTDNPFLDAIFQQYNSYTADGAWGKRSGSTSIFGVTYTIMYYIIPFIYFVIFLISVKNFKEIRNKKVLSIFQTAMLFYPNYVNFVTLSERNLLVLSITTTIVLLMLLDIKKKMPKLITINSVLTLTMLIFTFNIYKVNGAVKLSNVFDSGTYEKIRNRSYYIPSVLLLDYKDFGYSDEFVKANQNITF